MPTLYGTFTRIDLADGVLVAVADDTTVRVCAAPSPDVERLTADVARLEREAVDLTHGREDDHADHAAAFRHLATLALRGAAAAGRRAAGGSR